MSSPTIPNPELAAVQGTVSSAQNYPYEYAVNALSQEGASGTVQNPFTGQSQNLNFTGQGTADVQNQFQNQMAQTLLNIQQNLGPGYVQQQLADLQQADPTGYAAYNQLFQQIQNEANQPGADLGLSESTQNAINNILSSSQTLSPQSLSQVQQGVRGNQVASGIYLGNAPAQAEAQAVVGATDAQQAQGQATAQNFLASGTDPADIQYRQEQQNMANLGSFVNGTTPTSQFSSISGSQTGAANVPNSGYSTPGLNESSGAQQGINNAYGLYSANADFSNNQVNPYLAGFSTASNVANTAANLGYSFNSSPYSADFSNQTSPGVFQQGGTY